MSVNNERVNGSVKNIAGKAKETFGKATADQKTHAEGKAKQAEDKAQNTVRSAKDKAKD